MFQCGDHVVYGIHGVCRLLEPEVKKVDRAEIAYYVLEPINQSKDRFYVPMNNQTAVEKMKPILSRQELDQLLHSDAVNNDAWISDENLRKQTYRNLISSGDRTALISMVHTLQQRKELLAESGKRLHMCDENFLNDALRVLNSEFSMVLEMKQEAVSDYVRSILCEK